MKASINIHVDEFENSRSTVTVHLDIYRGEESPPFYEEKYSFYVSPKDSPEEIYESLKEAEIEISYWDSSDGPY